MPAISNRFQLGSDADATKNFTVQTNVDGSGKLARGNAGETTQDIITWDASGVVKLPQQKVAFSAYQSSAQTLAANTLTKLLFQTEEYDLIGDFANSRFTAPVAGVYRVTGGFRAGQAACYGVLKLYRVGADYKTLDEQPGNSTAAFFGGSCDVYLDAGEYIELYGSVSVAQSLLATSSSTYFQASLSIPN